MIQRRVGFTLVELMIVITIIGMLSALSIATLNSAQAGSRDTQRKTQILNIQSALERYRTVNGVYAAQWSAARGNACTIVGITDNTGLGPCYFNINDTVSGGTTDVLFTTDNTSPPSIAASAILLPYMAKPPKLSSSFPSGSGAFPVANGSAGNVIDFSYGTINYRVQNTYYMIRTVLEKKGTAVTSGVSGALCSGSSDGYFTTTNATYNVWKELVYPIPNNTNDCTTYKIYQRSNLSASTP